MTDAALADLDRLYEYGILAFELTQANKYYDGLVSYFQATAGSPFPYSQVGCNPRWILSTPYCSNSAYSRLENSEVVIVQILGR